jgi:phosphoribosylaminoimidazole carboxylase PurE protein
MANIQVSIIVGSKSDLPIIEGAKKMLDTFGVAYEEKVLSAHRTPKETSQYAESLKQKGVKVVICGAGMSAALPGVVAAHTTLPVFGVPIDASSLNGMDALLATVQMPPGVPVGAVAIGKPGAKNAALLALRVLALSDKDIDKKLEEFREDQRKTVLGEK